MEREVPSGRLLIAFHMCQKGAPDYFTFYLISDLLGSGHSSRLDKNLVIRKKMFTEITAYITAAHDSALLVFNGRLNNGVLYEEAE